MDSLDCVRIVGQSEQKAKADALNMLWRVGY
jgi:hypothetical protein